MNILIANDDGVFAPGLQSLGAGVKTSGAGGGGRPESERSGYSSALTLDRPLRPIPISGRCLGCQWAHLRTVSTYP